MRVFSYKNRPVHLGPYPLESLPRTHTLPDLASIPAMERLKTNQPDISLAHSISRYLAVMDTVRDGDDVHEPADIPADPTKRSHHLKSAAYFFDASMVGISHVPANCLLETPRRNPAIDTIRHELEHGDLSQFSAGVEDLYNQVLASTRVAHGPVDHHTHAMVLLTEYPRDPSTEEPGTDWIQDIQAERAALLNANTAVVIANYIRLLGFEARAHTVTSSEVDLNRLGVLAGLCGVDGDTGDLTNPFVGTRFGLAAITTNMQMTPDRPLAPEALKSGTYRHGSKWAFGLDGVKTAADFDPYQARKFRDGPHPYETLKRRETPTTFIDEPRVPRVPKRTNFFIRAIYGDLGKRVQDASIDDMFVAKSPIGGCSWRALGSLLLLQFGEARGPISPSVAEPARNADNIKGASHFLSIDATGLSRAPDWVWYSHDGEGEPLTPYHDNAVSLLLDQGHETMEGASGDDWVSVAQSMRAYLRFSLLGGVIAEHIRRLGYSARVHTVIDGDVIQPPLTLLAGLGEVSRIGDVILNPFLGPRLKSGVITTSMPMAYDKPIDFGLQNFCESCNKCARECPSGAITAGPKTMFNGYEIWKSDAEKCTRYRITNAAGGMCGRCMKTCPWNLEGLFSDTAFRWLAMNAPASAKTLAKLDDALGRGRINPVKKWWWDIEYNEARTRFVQAQKVNARELQKEIHLRPEDQSLAAYSADIAPSPHPVIQPIDRDEGIRKYRLLISPAEHKARIAAGDTKNLVPVRSDAPTSPPVISAIIRTRTDLTKDITKLEIVSATGDPLPPFDAGAHIDIVVAPEFHRQFSLAGDPGDNSKYVLGIQREAEGRGGSERLHKVFHEGRRIHISPPRNHFPLDEAAPFTLLMAGGIGVTPLIAMAHRLHALDRPFLLHFSAKSEAESGFATELNAMPWGESVFCHFSNTGNRANFADLIPAYRSGYRLYTCGGDRYMTRVFETGAAKDWPETALSREYFSVTDQGEYVNHAFALELSKSRKRVDVPADMTAAEALQAAGVPVDVKCSDGLCGVCTAHHLSGEIEHRDFVLSKAERAGKLTLCCSRAATVDGVIKLDL